MSSNDENDWQKLPTDQKVQHKVYSISFLIINMFDLSKAWKARMIGYDECVQLFRSQTSDQSAEFVKYVHLMKKFVLDSNENAREKALDAVFAFVQHAAIAGK